MFKEIFKYKKPIPQFLIQYGFKNSGGTYSYSVELLDTAMTLTVNICSGTVGTTVTDNDSGDEYTLYKISGAEGTFVGEIREKCFEILSDISEKCFEKEIFKNDLSKAIIEHARDKYKDEFEYLWDKFPENAVVRRKDNKKWYAALLTTDGSKFGLPAGTAEILDLRVNPAERDSIVDEIKIFPGYHMNKKHWITVLLNGSVEFERIQKLIDESYAIAGRRK